MSTMTIDAGVAERTTGGTPTRRPVRERRPGQGSGRTAAPTLRPGRSVPAPELRRVAPVGPRGCDVPVRPQAARPQTVRPQTERRRPARPVAVAPVRSAVRLTERGIAVVLVTGVMIAVAALTVVGATAARVTSDGYPSGAVSLSSNR
ncbi:hypothetical protein FHX74_003046 [Friedmanniella endophytica]|uniref:Uncharacterized protein n=1 Tax=Microlunatus kandeliicorticis TaxID=1759536 RepID=A0A7W3IUH9_9ACTN|nr:hypothetical protein [Microlunatus kandeliicorticis]MBA8795410.1 hypothetical protein [Microlunatus kandeliicorticis]